MQRTGTLPSRRGVRVGDDRAERQETAMKPRACCREIANSRLVKSLSVNYLCPLVCVRIPSRAHKGMKRKREGDQQGLNAQK